jgi:uncharacterized membrane protein YheB (UPF0754 family)
MGDVSNAAAFLFMLLGIVLYNVSPSSVPIKYVLSFGLFSFAGGITNWLAIKMLFDKIPFLYGSGVIPRQFVVIRETVKNTIMKTFFDSDYLEDYINDRAKGMLADFDLSNRIKDGLNKPEFGKSNLYHHDIIAFTAATSLTLVPSDAKLAKKLTEMSEQPEGMLIATMIQMFGSVDMLVPVVKPLITGFADEFSSQFTENFDIKEFVTVEKIRNELDKLMTEKLKQLTPEVVKALMEQVIREHLSWLIVWGNVFGGLLGVVSQAFGYGA